MDMFFKQTLQRERDVDMFNDLCPLQGKQLRHQGCPTQQRITQQVRLFYPLVMTSSLRHRKWPLEIVDLPIKNGDFP